MHHFNGHNLKKYPITKPSSLVASGCATAHHQLSPHLLLTSLNTGVNPTSEQWYCPATPYYSADLPLGRFPSQCPYGRIIQILDSCGTHYQPPCLYQSTVYCVCLYQL